MSPIKLGVFAQLALAANAFLVPPSITADDLGDDHAMEGLVIDPFKRSVAIPCPGCSFATAEGNTLKWKKNAGNAFMLDFGVGPLQDALIIDGYQLYPPSFSLATEAFHITQIDPSSENGLRLRVTGYHFRYNGAQTVSEDGMELLPMDLEITSVEGESVQALPLTINVLKDVDGGLMIASFQTTQPTMDERPKKDCNEWPLYCKWKGIVSDRIENMKKMGKGCHGRPHGQHNPMAEETTEGKPPHRFHPGRPHDHPHHRPQHKGHEGHRHHPHHRFHMFLRRAFFTILVPILIGIFAGTVTYLIGMALGCLVAVVIAKIRGQSYQRIALEDVEEGEVLENESESKEAYSELPAYDAPPVYEDAVEKEDEATK